MREDKSEREFSIQIDPGLAIVNESVKPASIGQPYTETLTAKQVMSLNPPTGNDVQASWSVESGALPPGLALSPQGLLTGTPDDRRQLGLCHQSAERQHDRFEDVCAHRPPAPEREVSVRPGAAAEQRSRDSPREDLHRRGRKRPLHLGTRIGHIAHRRRARPDARHDRGTPQTAGVFAFGVTATDSEGRVTGPLPR